MGLGLWSCFIVVCEENPIADELSFGMFCGMETPNLVFSSSLCVLPLILRASRCLYFGECSWVWPVKPCRVRDFHDNKIGKSRHYFHVR